MSLVLISLRHYSYEFPLKSIDNADTLTFLLAVDNDSSLKRFGTKKRFAKIAQCRCLSQLWRIKENWLFLITFNINHFRANIRVQVQFIGRRCIEVKPRVTARHSIWGYDTWQTWALLNAVECVCMCVPLLVTEISITRKEIRWCVMNFWQSSRLVFLFQITLKIHAIAMSCAALNMWTCWVTHAVIFHQ